MTDRIEKTIEIKAPVSRVWQALTDYREFGTWFRVRLERPVRAGQGCGRADHLSRLRARADGGRGAEDEPERLFSFTWHPYAVDPEVDYSEETPTLVEFTLEPTAQGTLLRVVESGFDKIPAHRRDEAFRMNEGGWEAADEEHRAPCPTSGLAGSPRSRRAPSCSPPSATRRGSRSLAKLLSGEPQSISRLTEGTHLTRQAVSQNICASWKDAGVVRSARSGREALFELQPRPIEDARAYLDRIAQQWDDALNRLKLFVED